MGGIGVKTIHILMRPTCSLEITPGLSLGLSPCVCAHIPLPEQLFLHLWRCFFLHNLSLLSYIYCHVIISFRLLPERALNVLKKLTDVKFDAVVGQRSTQ